jgi:DNA-binding transcriptional MerR regulator
MADQIIQGNLFGEGDAIVPKPKLRVIIKPKNVAVILPPQNEPVTKPIETNTHSNTKPSFEKSISLKKPRGRKNDTEREADGKLLAVPINDVLFSKHYYTIGETATMLNATVSQIRFWQKNFSKYLPVKTNKKGNRYFKPQEVKTLEQIQFLLRVQKLTINGVKNYLAQKGNNLQSHELTLHVLNDLKAFLLELQARL